MNNHLEIIAKSYDKAIETGRKENNGIDPYKNLPEYIKNDPDYIKYEMEINGKSYENESDDIIEYLSPKSNMKFIDLGCALKLMFKGYDKWESEYYGVDISKNTIDLLNEYVNNNNLIIGKLYCGSIDKIPFNDNYFEIGECIGIFEYYDSIYLKNVVKEIHRIMKPDGKFVLDIPNIKSPSGRIMCLIEEYLERPCKFNIFENKFEDMIREYFEIVKKDNGNGNSMGIRYYLKVKNK